MHSYGLARLGVRFPLARQAAFLLVAFCLALGSCANPSERIELIVEGDWVLTFNESGDILRHGAIAIDDGEILAVGSRSDILATYSAREVLPGTGRVAMPGLINGHTHAAMTLLRGIGNDRNLQDWLQQVIFPLENAHVDESFVRTGTELACWEMLRGGTTTFVDMYFFPDAVAETVESCGARAIVVPTVMDQASPDARTGAESLAQAIDFVIRWEGKSSRVVPALGGHAIYTLAEDTLVSLRDAALELNAPISIHVSESLPEREFSRSTYGMTPIQKLDEIGFFDASVIAAHVVYADNDDTAVLSRRRVGIIHNPTSNMKLASGVAPLPEYLGSSVLLGLGTDGPASNNDLNMWEEMRLAAFLQKVSRMDPAVVPAETALELATSRAAEAVGLADQVGSISPGLRADIIQVAIDKTDHLPVYDPVAHLVYVTDEADVVNVVVEGAVVVRDGNVTTIDEQALRASVETIAARIRTSVGASDDQVED